MRAYRGRSPHRTWHKPGTRNLHFTGHLGIAAFVRRQERKIAQMNEGRPGCQEQCQPGNDPGRKGGFAWCRRQHQETFFSMESRPNRPEGLEGAEPSRRWTPRRGSPRSAPKFRGHERDAFSPDELSANGDGDPHGHAERAPCKASRARAIAPRTWAGAVPPK